MGGIGRYSAEYVFRLDVSVGNTFAVDIHKSVEDLADNPSNLHLSEGVVLCEKREEVASGRELGKYVPVRTVRGQCI